MLLLILMIPLPFLGATSNSSQSSIMQIPSSDLLVKSLSQENNRIQREIAAQMLAAQQLAEAEFAQLAASQQSNAAAAATAAPSSVQVASQAQKKVRIS
jgi:hypothetical protein